MSRTLKSEFAAHATLAQHAITQAQTRADWRAVLAARDSKRTAYVQRNNRKAHALTIGTMFASVCAMVCNIRFPSL